jgi:hypothetical protein
VSETIGRLRFEIEAGPCPCTHCRFSRAYSAEAARVIGEDEDRALLELEKDS